MNKRFLIICYASLVSHVHILFPSYIDRLLGAVLDVAVSVLSQDKLAGTYLYDSIVFLIEPLCAAIIVLLNTLYLSLKTSLLSML